MSQAAPGSMLQPRDGLLHQPPFNESTWLETNWFSFLVPERTMRGHIVVGFRSNLGVVFANIMVYSTDSTSVLDFDYYDARVHLPMPRQNLDRYSLDNGLSVVMVEPLKRYELTYKGFGGTRFELSFEGLMPAIESREVTLPGGKDFSHFHARRAALRDTVGHIDQTQMVTGVVVINGDEIEVAYPSNHDHSWSPRPEFDHSLGNFDEGYFGTDLMFHVQTLNPSLEEGAVINGYIVKEGEVRRLKAGAGRYKVHGWAAKSLEYELEDDHGESYLFVGEPVATAYLPTYPNQYILGGVTRWSHGADVGWGEYKWHWEVSEMQIASRRGPGS